MVSKATAIFWDLHNIQALFSVFSFSPPIKQRMCVCAESLQLQPTLCNPMDSNPSGSSVHGIFQQVYWSELPCPPPGDLPDPGIEQAALTSPELVGRFFTCTIWKASDFSTCGKFKRGKMKAYN